MQALKAIFLVLAIISLPLVSLFLIRITLKLGKGIDRLNATLDDARPQVTILLANLNHTMEEVNHELENVTRMTEEAEGMLRSAGASLRSVEKALHSPWARLGGILASLTTTATLLRLARRRLAGGCDS